MITKSEMKKALSSQFEQGFTQAREAASDDALRWDGGAASLKGAVTAVEALEGHLARDVKEEKLTIEEAQHVRRYVRRAVEIVRSLQVKAQVQQQKALGRVEAFDMATRMATKNREQAEARMAELGEDEDEAVVSDASRPKGKLEELRARKLEDMDEDETSGEDTSGGEEDETQ